MDGAYRALAELRKADHVKAIGVGINEPDVASDFVRAGEFDCVMLAGRHTLLDQAALDKFLPLALARRSTCSRRECSTPESLLRRRPIASRPMTMPRRHPRSIERATRVAAVCSAYGVPVQAAAARFPLSHPAVKTIVLGMSKPEHVRQTLAWLDLDIHRKLRERLKAEGLLRADAPIPQETKRQ
jgi:D-threo-aldose 1-dehydrogenase